MVKIKKSKVVSFFLIHCLASVALCVYVQVAHWKTIWFAILLYVIGAFGVTIGLHRLWSHRSFKAVLPLRVILLCASSIANQGSIIHWVRDHRVHHRYAETVADPHDATRGLFFSHIGWLLVYKDQAVIDAGLEMDLSDVLADPVVQFECKYYHLLVLLFCFVLPTIIPWYIWGESLCTAFMVAGVLRLVLLLHATWCVNSLAHTYGTRPYSNTSRGPAENMLVSILSMGEGWHDWHHAYPYDYACSERGYVFNPSKWVIDGFAKIGWVWDRKRGTRAWERRQSKRLSTS